MNRVHVASVSLITGLGGFNATWEGLMSGKSAIKPVTRFAADRLNGSMATCIEGLEGERGDRSLVEPILDRLLADFGPVPADSRLILATTKGAIDYIERIKRGVDAETEGFMAESLLRNISCRLGLTATAGGININAACASSTIALGRGASLIAHGQVEAVVVCCLDLVSEFVFSGFSALQGLSRGPCRPFDRGRDGLTLGEGGAALLLMSEGRLRREDRSSLGTILGWGTANDANHITAPARDGCGLIQAVNQAMKTARVTAGDIAAVNAHGTGTMYNDLMELTAFRTLFSGRQLPIHSVKGAIGHTLGAAGGIETVVALRSLAEGVIPPTAGFSELEEGAEGLVSAGPLEISGDTVLSTNSGFGGVNAALLLGKGECL